MKDKWREEFVYWWNSNKNELFDDPTDEDENAAAYGFEAAWEILMYEIEEK